MPNKLVLTFHDFSVTPKEPGLRFVVFRLDDLQGAFITYDYGFCNWTGTEWESLSDQVQARVMKWCDLPQATMMVM